jgi:putative SOS response-associated peptidase YedK
MPELSPHVTHARALLADIHHSPDILLPRRETLTDWLDAFLVRAEAPAYDLQETEAADLIDLDQYLRTLKMPAAAPAQLAS